MTNNENSGQARYDDEISLVDLASTFLRRRRVFYGVFLAFLLVGLAYAFFVPAQFEYVSLVKLAEKEGSEYVEEPSAVIAKLDNHWMPELKAAYRSEKERKLPFDVTMSNPKGTGLVRLVTEATYAQASKVEGFHGKVLEQLEREQSADVSTLRKRLEKRIESLDATIEMLKSTKDAGSSLAAAIEQRGSLEAELVSIQPAEVLVVSRQSADPAGPAKSLVIVLATLLGAIVGIFSAFLAEFVGLVRDSMVES